MSKLILKSIRLRNWTTVRESFVEFPEYGVVLVTGANSVSLNKLKSVGSGKTALGEAISRPLGATGRFTSLRDYSRAGKGDTYLDVNYEMGGVPLRVEIGYKCKEMNPTGEGIRFKYGDLETVSRSHIEGTKSELYKTIGCTPSVSEWTVYVDGDKLKFHTLGESDRVNLLMSVLNQPPWTDYHANALSTHRNSLRNAETASRMHTGAVEELEGSRGKVEELRARVKELKEEADLQSRKAKESGVMLDEKIRGLVAKQENIDTDLARIKKRMAKLEETKAVQNKELEVTLNDCRNTIREARKSLTSAIESRSAANQKLKAARDLLHEYESEPETCPTCGGAWTKKHGQSKIKEAQSNVERLQGVLQDARSIVSRAEDAVSKHEKAESRIQDQINSLNASGEYRSLSRDYETGVDHLRKISRQIEDLKDEKRTIARPPDLSELQQAEGRLLEKEKRMADLEEKAKRYKSECDEAYLKSKISEYWVKAFSSTGIPNTILKRSIEPLNAASERISTEMTGGVLSVRYSTDRMLVTGGEKSQLMITVDNRYGSSKVQGSSKGEAGLTNLIVAETLAEVGNMSNRVGFKWYDEVINSQDKIVRRNFFERIKRMAHERKILIFVVDHHMASASHCDYVLTAEKTSKGTTYRWD